MNLLVTLILILVTYSTSAANYTTQSTPHSIQHTNQAKTKRTISDVQNYGENKPILVLVDNVASSSSNIPTLYPNPKPLVLKPVFESEAPKQVAAQQVLYEFQQTPTNAVSNVHVNQLFQPFEFVKEPTNPQIFTTESPISRQPYARGLQSPPIQTSESIASPVQHTALINHGQNYAHVQFTPSIPPPGTPQHIQTHHYIPGKYLYVNGKIIYQPAPLVQTANNAQATNAYNVPNQQNQQNHHQQVQGYNQNSLSNTAPQNFVHHPSPNYIQHPNKRPVSYIAYNTPRLPKQNLTPPPRPGTPIRYTNTNFHPPTRLQPITKPMTAPVSEQEEEEESEENDKASIKDDEEEVEDSEDDEEDRFRGSYKEDDEEDDRSYEGNPERYSNRYSYNDDDDNDDHQSYRHDEEEAEEDDEDNERGSSKWIPTKTKKNSKKKSFNKKYGKSPKYDKNNDYKYSESYATKTEYETPTKRTKKNKGKSKSKSKPEYFKTVRYTKQSNGKPKIETIEGRQSQHVPVVEKRKLFQERWVVSKSTDALSA